MPETRFTSESRRADVVVIGGGPGGSTAATMLARKGWQVLLLERERFPREHVGESLLPASLPVLAELGVLPAVEAAGFVPKGGATMVWGKDKTPWSWYFRETNAQYPHAYQVWRPTFDQLLLDNSRQHGVEVREGHQVTDVLFEATKAVGVRYVTPSGASATVRAPFVVDASGQGALLGRKLQVRRWDPLFQNMAIYAYLTGVERLPAPDDGNIFIESYAHGWFWHIPLHTGWTSVGAVVDSDSGQAGLRHSDPLAFFKAQVAAAPHTAHRLQHATLVAGPFVVKDWSYVSDEVAGDGYVLVGDAACFVDPLFSAGVHLALTAGVLAAALVTTALKDPGSRQAAGRVYKELYYKEYDHFRAMAQLFYASNRSVTSYFWEARRLIGAPQTLSPRHAFIHAVAGQSPRGYERAVLAQGDAPIPFVASVRGIEAERRQRQRRLDAAQAALDLAVPRLADGVRVQRKPILDAGEFVWGEVLVTAGYPEGLPCSRLVSAMVASIDGRRSVAELIDLLSGDSAAPQRQQIITGVLAALRILYADGTIAELRGL
jgi:flavin-dependent dehydrogenase